MQAASWDWDVVVVGAGAAGLVAAERAAARGRRTLLLERNRKPGVKILMSGGTRCNLTQATDRRGIVAAFGTPGRFLHSALAALGPQDLVALVEAEGVATKTEATGKIFPCSNRAADVLAAFLARLQRSGCQIALAEPLVDIEHDAGRFRLTTELRTISAERVIVTTGGQSYPGCGTTGDGYAWAAKLGHTIVWPRPALVPVTVGDDWVRALQGVTVPDAGLRLISPDAPHATLDQCRGSLLFTHFGVSGPVALDISRSISGHREPGQLRLLCDLVPDTPATQLDDQLRQLIAAYGKRRLAAIVPEGLPQRLVDATVLQAGLQPDQRAAELSKGQRALLVQALKQATLRVVGTLGFTKAEVTAGGVDLGEVDSRTMESKRCAGLFLAGELLDLDGPIGGYNFQAAFSTGWLAGNCV